MRWLVILLVVGCESDAPPPPPAVAPRDSLTRIEDVARLADYRDPKAPYDCTITPTLQRYFAGLRVEACGMRGIDATPAELTATERCAAKAIAAAAPVVFGQEVQGTDSGVTDANLVRMEHGRYVAYEAHFDSDPCGGGCPERGWTRIARCAGPPRLAAGACFDHRSGACLPCDSPTLVETCRHGKPSTRSLREAEQARPNVFGATPASLGPAFGPLALGAAFATWKTPAVVAAIADIELGGIVAVGEDRTHGPTIDSVTLAFAGPCTAIHALVVARWGNSPDDTWLAPASQRRARFDLADCEVRIETYAGVATWVAETQTAPFPLAAIGAAAAPFAKRVGSVVESGSQIRWRAPGIGRGTGPVEMNAEVMGGRIIRISGTGATDDATIAELRTRLTALRGPPRDGDLWRGRLDLDAGSDYAGGGKFQLSIGEGN